MEMNSSLEMEEALREIEELKGILSEREQRDRVFADYIGFGLWEYDIKNDIFRVFKKLNGEYCENPKDIKGFRELAVSRGSVYAEDIVEFNRFCDSLERGEKDFFCEMRVVDEDFGIIWERLEGRAVLSSGKPVKVLGRTVDITREKDDAASGRHDPLTGLCTAALFRDIVSQKRSGVNRYDNCAFLSVGIDEFRSVAASSGKEYSDTLQKTVAAILTEIASQSRDSVLSRIRDGEFLLYLGFGGADVCDKIARRIISRVNDTVFEGEPITVSVGISRMRSGKKPDELYGESFLALNDAQKSGGGCYVHYRPAMSSRQYDHHDSESSSSSGMTRFYDLILKAFCNEKERNSLLRSAFRTVGQVTGASAIKAVLFTDNGSVEEYNVFTASGISEENMPYVIRECSVEEFNALFDDDDSLRVYEASDRKTGLRLENGATCAECRALRYHGELAGYFAVIFDSAFELSGQCLEIIEAMKNALTRMYSVYSSSRESRFERHIYGEIISDHRMEAFSIKPKTFELDYIGENASEHYNVHAGDVCYKKLRGRSEPCANCPALKLDADSSLMFASLPYYEEHERRWMDITASVDENAAGERRYIISSTDITDCLGKIRVTDSLTGVMTFDSFTGEALRLTSENNTGYYITVVNIAQFRRLNESHGFEMGNMILIAVADILMRCVGEGEIICRNEGSRFIILYKGNNSDDIEKRLGNILLSIQNQVYDKFKIQIYLLAGVCGLNDDALNVMGALDRAITAQHTIKDEMFYHKNMIVFYDGILREAIKERRRIEANMVGALENGEFKVYYQPKVNITTGEIVGAEALVRWIRPDGTMISPGKFVPIFEQNGFITDMDFAIYRSAVADIAKWLRSGIDVPLISLNVSRYHLGDENFCEKLNALVDSLGVPHEFIELEITESLLTENLDKLVETVTWLKARGFRISVDDFGSGYSSLNLITQLPFDTLMIDGGFFLRNDLTDKNKKVISSVVTLAKSLNLETVSEGVETQTQVDFLRDLGCDMIQGFFYYKPMPSDDFRKLLIAQGNRATAEQSDSSVC